MSGPALGWSYDGIERLSRKVAFDRGRRIGAGRIDRIPGGYRQVLVERSELGRCVVLVVVVGVA